MTALEECEISVPGLRGGGVVTGQGVVGEAAKEADVARGPGVLEAAHAQVAAGYPGQNGAGQERLALHRTSRRDDGEGTGRGDVQRVHRLAHDVFAQHGTDHRLAVPVAGKRRAS